MLRSPRFYLAFIFLGLFSTGGYFFQKEWKISRARCEAAALLIREAREVVDLTAETAKDPFVEFHAAPALLDPALARYRESVRSLLAKKWSFHLKEQDLASFRRLETSEKTETALALLETIAAQSAPEKCPLTKDKSRVPASDPGLPLQRWLNENRGVVTKSRAQWTEDQATYCRTEKAHFTIFLAKRTMEERCAKGKKGACRREQFQQLETELAEIDQRLKLNREKIHRKWGAKLAGRVLCSSP